MHVYSIKKFALDEFYEKFSNFSKKIKNNEKWMVVSANKNQIRKNKLEKGDILFTPTATPPTPTEGALYADTDGNIYGLNKNYAFNCWE